MLAKTRVESSPLIGLIPTSDLKVLGQLKGCLPPHRNSRPLGPWFEINDNLICSPMICLIVTYSLFRSGVQLSFSLLPADLRSLEVFNGADGNHFCKLFTMPVKVCNSFFGARLLQILKAINSTISGLKEHTQFPVLLFGWCHSLRLIFLQNCNNLFSCYPKSCMPVPPIRKSSIFLTRPRLESSPEFQSAILFQKSLLLVIPWLNVVK